MQLVKKCAGLALVVAALAACNNVDFKKTKGGMAYKIFPGKGTAKLAPGKFVKAEVTQKLKDSTVFSSYGTLPYYFPVPEQSNPYDPSEVLPLLKEGDSAYMVQMMDTFIKRNPEMLQRTPYRNGDKIVTTFKILKVFDNQQQMMADQEGAKASLLKKEDATVQAYLKQNNIQAQRTPAGAYVQVLEPGTGAKCAPGKYVDVMYKGTTFGGKTFDSNMDATFKHTEPLGFVVGMGQMIKGMDEGVQLLSNGGKAKIFIPSALGYGAQPPTPDIKPFEHLIFDVQVVDVKDKAPAQSPMGQPMPMDTAAPPRQ